MLFGDLEDGFKLYEYRWKNKSIINLLGGIRNFSEPLWLGEESLKGKTIYLYAEQGLGDTIQFCRYVTLLAQLGANVILEVQPSLVNLLSRLEGVAKVIARGSSFSLNFDFQCPLLSLPLAFKTTVNSIPAPLSYLSCNEEKKLYWSEKLGTKSRPRVGLVWSGSTIHKNDKNRSLLLSQLIKFLPNSFQYICLQKEIREIDKKTFNEFGEIKFYGDELSDFSDTAALIDLMDLVVTVDTSVAHLAGSLGKKTWILLPYTPDFRWLLDRDDSPWYPSVKLLRQTKHGDWSLTLHNLRDELTAL